MAIAIPHEATSRLALLTAQTQQLQQQLQTLSRPAIYHFDYLHVHDFGTG